MTDVIQVRPQDRQLAFLESSADIVIFGGAAGGGKTFSILMENLYHVHVPRFTSTIFRKTYPQIMRQGGLWDESFEVFQGVTTPAPTPSFGLPGWKFPSGAEVRFSHMDDNSYMIDNQGAQICMIGFDQLEQFSGEQFFFMMSRNRSMCGVRPYMRGTANPQPGWLAEFIDWWIDPDGYANLERSGKVRWFVRLSGQMQWADSYAELKYKYPDCEPKSVTFILSTIYDNPALLAKNPGYLASLKNLPDLERQRLLGDPQRGGNWKIKAGGTHFKRGWFKIIPQAPADLHPVRRFWDMAATPPELASGKGDPDFLAGALVGFKAGQWFICDMKRDRLSPKDAKDLIWQTAVLDSSRVPVRMEIEGGSSGKTVVDDYARTVFIGRDFQGRYPHGSKAVRAQPFSAAAQAGNVFLIEGAWNSAFLDEADSFTGEDMPGVHDDQIDCIAGAMQDISESLGGNMLYIPGQQLPLDNLRRTLDDSIRKQYESITDPEEKLKAAKALQAAGFTI